MRAVVANESNVIFNGAIATQPFVVQNQMKGLAVSGDKKLVALPNLPTFKEMNTPVFDTGSWQGFFASKGTRAPMVARLNSEIRKILATPEVSKKIVELGGELKDGTPEDLSKFVTSAIAQWGEIIKAENLSLD